jgi:hypothetical protein
LPISRGYSVPEGMEGSYGVLLWFEWYGILYMRCVLRVEEAPVQGLSETEATES